MEKPKTILLVDDEPAIRRLLNQKLRQYDYHCLEAGSAEKALEILRSNEIDLVILDGKMPGKSGFDLLPEIAAGYPDTSVIMATAVSDTSMAIRCMKEGANDYLIKPFNLEEVSIAVERALETRRLRMENRDYQVNLELKVKEQAGKIRDSFLNSLKALVRALEAKDDYTSDHSRRVADIAVAIARDLGMTPDDIEKIRIAGLIHDIGKIGVKEAILNKPGRLTAEEYDQVKIHPEIGANILVLVVEDSQVLESVVHHHERYDGTGYPGGLSGNVIPIGARILAVADAYDAITSGRPYRDSMSTEVARAEIKRGEGTQFDPVIAETLLMNLNSADPELERDKKYRGDRA